MSAEVIACSIQNHAPRGSTFVIRASYGQQQQQQQQHRSDRGSNATPRLYPRAAIVLFVQVLQGMFGLAGRLFGVSITPADGEAEVWNPDVRFFNIKDKSSGGEMVGDGSVLLGGDAA